MKELSNRHIFITLFFIFSCIQNFVANEREEDTFYEGTTVESGRWRNYTFVESENEGSDNTVQSGRWRNYTFVENENEGSRDQSGRWRNYTFVETDYEGSRLPPLIAVIIIAANVGAMLCGCGSCIFVICICFKKCKKNSTAINEEGNPNKETEMTTQVPPTGSKLNPAPPGDAQVPTHSPTMPMDQKPHEKHQLAEGYGYPTNQKPIEKYQPPQPFGYPSGQQAYTPLAQPGLNATQPGYIPVQSGYGPAQPGYGPTQPGCGLTQSGHGLTQPGCGPTQPGHGLTQPGCGPTQPGHGPTQPGHGPTHPGCGPTQPGKTPAKPGYILAQPVYSSGQPNLYKK